MVIILHRKVFAEGQKSRQLLRHGQIEGLLAVGGVVLPHFQERGCHAPDLRRPGPRGGASGGFASLLVLVVLLLGPRDGLGQQVTTGSRMWPGLLLLLLLENETVPVGITYTYVH